MDATRTPADPHHTQALELSWEEVEALGALEGSHVAVRVIERTKPEALVVFFLGHLGHRRGEALFWPVRAASKDEPGNGGHRHPPAP